MKAPRFKRFLAAFLSVTLAGPVAYGYYRWEQGNFDTVSPAKVYRSRQLSGPELVEVVQRHGIKSILNLRGENQGGKWYRDEKAVVDQFHVRLFDYPISAHRELTAEEVTGLLKILREAPKPLLIHCKSGADRTALVSAMYLHGLEGLPAVEAGRQLSLYYGHIPPMFGAESSAMDRTFWRIVGLWEALDRAQLAHSPAGVPQAR